MPLKTDPHTGASAEIKIVPLWAWILAGLGFVAVQGLFYWFFPFAEKGLHPTWTWPLFGIIPGLMIACYLVLLGYVNRDAKRRGMSPALWTFVAIIIPNALGIVLYFVLRHPLAGTCPQCGNAVQAGFKFCPRCSYKLGPSCPRCGRAIGANDAFCPHCGAPQQAAETN